nr:NAD(P)-dependent oxidoreductase [Kallipyga massiliensis]
MARKVLLAQDVDPSGKRLLEDNGFEWILAPKEDEKTIIDLIADCEAVFSKTYFLNENILKAGKKLKVVAKHGAGIDNVVDLKTATKLGIYVVRTPLANADSVAEHTVGGMLAFNQKIIQMHNATKVADFAQQECGDMHEIKEKTIGIIGLGNIGSRVAKICALGFDMKVIGYDPYVNIKNIPDYIDQVSDINRVYEESDYITLHLAATPETIDMVSEKQFDLMKKSAIFINQARGNLVVEDDLIKALKKRK